MTHTHISDLENCLKHSALRREERHHNILLYIYILQQYNLQNNLRTYGINGTL